MTIVLNIRQAARWAERKDALFIGGDFNEPLCAVYSTNTHIVRLMGSYDKCSAYITEHCNTSGFSPCSHLLYQVPNTTEWLCFESLDTICQETDESEGEALCLPDAWDQREWA